MFKDFHIPLESSINWLSKMRKKKWDNKKKRLQHLALQSLRCLAKLFREILRLHNSHSFLGRWATLLCFCSPPRETDTNPHTSHLNDESLLVLETARLPAWVGGTGSSSGPFLGPPQTVQLTQNWVATNYWELSCAAKSQLFANPRDPFPGPRTFFVAPQTFVCRTPPHYRYRGQVSSCGPLPNTETRDFKHKKYLTHTKFVNEKEKKQAKKIEQRYGWRAWQKGSQLIGSW